MADEGIFVHPCAVDGCKRYVKFDDEPACFEHSPDSGSNLPGYSAREAATQLTPNAIVALLVALLNKKINENCLGFINYIDDEEKFILGAAEVWLEARRQGAETSRDPDHFTGPY